MKIGEVVRRRRKKQGLTLEALANQIPGYDAGNLSKFERGYQSTTEDKLRQIAAILETTIADIYQESDSREGIEQQIKPSAAESSAEYLSKKDQEFIREIGKLTKNQRDALLIIVKSMTKKITLPIGKKPHIDTAKSTRRKKQA